MPLSEIIIIFFNYFHLLLTRHHALPVVPEFYRVLPSCSNPIAAGQVMTSLSFSGIYIIVTFKASLSYCCCSTLRLLLLNVRTVMTATPTPVWYLVGEEVSASGGHGHHRLPLDCRTPISDNCHDVCQGDEAGIKLSHQSFYYFRGRRPPLH